MAHMKNEEKAQKRFCDEITFQRDSLKSLPWSSHMFKIMTTDKTTKKRRLLSAAGLAENLERLLNISGGKLLQLRIFSSLSQSVNLSIFTIL